MRGVAWGLTGLLCFGIAMLTISFSIPGEQTALSALGGGTIGAVVGTGIGLIVTGRA